MLTYWRVCCAFESACALPSGVIRGCETTSKQFAVVWVAYPGFIFQKTETLPLGVPEEDCIFRSWAIEALEKVGIKYRIVYVSRSISGILDAVRAGKKLNRESERIRKKTALLTFEDSLQLAAGNLQCPFGRRYL